MFVFDTSAFINGWRDHYPPATFPGVWDLIDSALEDARIIGPREVYNEITLQDDDLHVWAKARRGLFVDPSPDVQSKVGPIYAKFPHPGVRDAADPFIIAEATVRGFTVVTYEGRTFAGAPTPGAAKKMPGLCKVLGVECCTLPEALQRLGGSFR